MTINKQQKTPPHLLSPSTLAFVGDVVYELLVRQRLVAHGDRPVGRLHNLAVEQVRASAQAEAYHILEPHLSEKELAVLKRGRNANTASPPKNTEPQHYRKATGVETLFGLLHLQGQNERINELFELIISAQASPKEE